MLINTLNSSKKNILHYSVLLFLVYLAVFIKVGAFHMRWWDESLYAVNTYEMIGNKKFFTAYFNGNIDLFNTKPPLILWVQIVFVKLLGYNELALRLPSAISAALTVILLFSFVNKRFNSVIAWFTALILLTAQGFIDFHTARTADADSLLTLLTLLSNICFINYLEKNKSIYILYFFCFLTLAFCTKMYAALLFLPAHFFILLQVKKLREFIFNRHFAIGILSFIILCAGILLLRELEAPDI